MAQTEKSKFLSLSLSTEEVYQKLFENLDTLQGQYGVGRIGLFGSFARGEQKPDSDIDLLVEFSRPIGLFKFVEFEGRLSEMLGARVGLVTRNAPETPHRSTPSERSPLCQLIALLMNILSTFWKRSAYPLFYRRSGL